VDSTNNYAMGLVHAGMAQHGICVFAHEQIKGKGQRNKRWISGSGENIILSIIVQPHNPSPKHLFLLSMMVAIGTHKFLSRYAGADTSIKWPNDLYWRDRKAGGILIENNIQGSEWKYAVIGIGLNINQTNFEDLPVKAVSLKQITGKSYDVVELAKELILDIQSIFDGISNNPAEIIDTYHKHLYQLQQTVKLKKGPRIFEAYIKGVTQDGKLITKTYTEELFNVGEIEWIPNND
jgi:BirA family transcriptional regulator, biotin operon repressor / biotin---[acetyl-CoA-carboxylase] ligase